MIHIYRKGSNENTLLLLHGTGGNEEDLLYIGKIIDPDANILSVRGNVLENNMPRFFRRNEEGVFDLEDLKFRTTELNDFLNVASIKFEFNRNKVIAIGYSNGANIAGSILFHLGKVLSGAILLRPMVPRRDLKITDLGNVKVFISAGLHDSICPPSEAKDLKNLLTNANADVHLEWINSTHRLTYNELEIARDWYNKYYKYIC